MTLSKSFGIYTVASFFNKGMMAVLAFFLSNYIVPAENGLLSLYNVFTAFLLPFVIMGMPTSLVMAHTKLDSKEYKIFFSSSLALSTFCFLVLLTLLFISGNIITGLLAVPFRLLLIGLLYTYFNLFQENILAYLRTLNKPWHFLLISAAKDLTEIALVILLVIIWHKGAEGRIFATVITAAITFAYGVIFFYRRGFIQTQLSKKYVKEELRFGISQVFFLLNVFILNGADKFLIHKIYPADGAGLGVYFMSAQLAFVINVVVSAFFFSYQPVLYNLLNNFTEENKFKMLRIKYLFAVGLLLCVVLLNTFIPFIYQQFINGQYHPGMGYVVWNTVAYFFWGLYAVMLGFLYYYKKNSIVTVLSVFSSLVCIVSNFYFIKIWGVAGAGYANLFTYCLLFITAFIIINKTCRLQLPWIQFRKIFAKA